MAALAVVPGSANEIVTVTEMPETATATVIESETVNATATENETETVTVNASAKASAKNVSGRESGREIEIGRLLDLARVNAERLLHANHPDNGILLEATGLRYFYLQVSFFPQNPLSSLLLHGHPMTIALCLLASCLRGKVVVGTRTRTRTQEETAIVIGIATTETMVVTATATEAAEAVPLRALTLRQAILKTSDLSLHPGRSERQRHRASLTIGIVRQRRQAGHTLSTSLLPTILPMHPSLAILVGAARLRVLTVIVGETTLLPAEREIAATGFPNLVPLDDSAHPIRLLVHHLDKARDLAGLPSLLEMSVGQADDL
jgi:hypothetical protein